MSTLLELLNFAGSHYLGLFAALAAAWSVGRRLTAGLEYRSELEAGVVSTALGLGIWSTCLMALGLVGLLRPLPILLLLAASQYVCRSSWVKVWEASRSWLEGSLSVGGILAAVVLGILLVPLFTLPLYPPTAFDATMFHLPFASSIAEQGHVDFFAHLRYPVFPALQESLYAGVLLFQDDVAPALLHFSSFLLVALLLYCWGSWLSSPRAGLWAALIWLGGNASVRNAIGAYVDCALALYVTTALFALHRYVRRGERGWLVVAAALVGFAAGTKYHGLYFVCVLSLGVAIYTLRHRRFRHLAEYAAVVAAAMLPWYGFIYYHTGSPVFPFFPAVFGMTPWAFELRYSDAVPMSQVDTGPLVFLYETAVLFKVFLNKAILMSEQGLVGLLRLPVEVFRGTGSVRGHTLSPLFLLGLPFMVLLMVRFRHARYLALIAGLYFIAWQGTAQELRYLIPALPIFALLAAEGADRLLAWLSPAARPRLSWLLTLAVTLPLALQVYWVSSELSWSQGRPPSTPAQRERFLELRLRPYAAIRTLNERHDTDYTVYAMFAENMRHFVDGEHLGDWFGPSRYGTILGKLHNRDALHRALGEAGADYLLLPNLRTWKPRLEDQYPLPPPRRLAPHFELDYTDRFIRIYRVVPPDELSASHAAEAPIGEGR